MRCEPSGSDFFILKVILGDFQVRSEMIFGGWGAVMMWAVVSDGLTRLSVAVTLTRRRSFGVKQV